MKLSSEFIRCVYLYGHKSLDVSISYIYTGKRSLKHHRFNKCFDNDMFVVGSYREYNAIEADFAIHEELVCFL